VREDQERKEGMQEKEKGGDEKREKVSKSIVKVQEKRKKNKKGHRNNKRNNRGKRRERSSSNVGCSSQKETTANAERMGKKKTWAAAKRNKLEGGVLRLWNGNPDEDLKEKRTPDRYREAVN